MPPKKRALAETDPNATSRPAKKSTKNPQPDDDTILLPYKELTKPELESECESRNLSQTGTIPTLIRRLKASDAAHVEKYKFAAKAPYSAHDAAKRPIGAAKAPLKALDEDKDHRDSTARQEKVLKRGPGGAPVFDRMGFELDYGKVKKIMRGGFRKRAATDGYMKMIERELEEDRRKAEIMGAGGGGAGIAHDAWQDRVSRDLGIPYHKVEMEDFEEWYERGFRAEKGEWDDISKEEEERLMALSSGSAFRK